MSGTDHIDDIINGFMEDSSISIPEIPPRSSLTKLPSVPVLYSSDPSEFISVMYENGSISYINLKTIPVIQRTVDDDLLLMWPDTTNGVFLKTLYRFTREEDPVNYVKIELFLTDHC